jgi:hypothetical protein
MCLLHSNMVDSPTSIVLLSGNRNRVDSTSWGRCSCSRWIDARVRVGASICKMTLLSTSETPPFSLQRVWSSLSPLNILISSSRGLEIIGALNHLMLRGSESLSS